MSKKKNEPGFVCTPNKANISGCVALGTILSIPKSGKYTAPLRSPSHIVASRINLTGLWVTHVSDLWETDLSLTRICFPRIFFTGYS